MSDTLLFSYFWLAFGGLIISLLGFTALFYFERQRSQITARLSRAKNLAAAKRSETAHRTAGSFAHASANLRRIVLRAGERLSALMGGEAHDTAAELSSAGFRSRDAVLIFAFLKTVGSVLKLYA